MWCELFQSFVLFDQDLITCLGPIAMQKRYSRAVFYEHLLLVHQRPSAMHVEAGLN